MTLPIADLGNDELFSILREMTDELFVFLFTVMHLRSPRSLARSLLGFTACWHLSVTLTILATRLTTGDL